MKKVLITGCNGQLGRALNALLKGQDIEIINTDVDSLDICNKEQVLDLVKQEMPDTIINCAAHTAVDKCETDEKNAYQINAIGPENLAKAAKEIDAQIVQVSTDYVFDGNTDKPYTEADTPCPQSVLRNWQAKRRLPHRQINTILSGLPGCMAMEKIL